MAKPVSVSPQAAALIAALKAMAKKHKLSLKAWAEKAGVSPNVFYNLGKGSETLHVRTLRLLADSVGEPVSPLLPFARQPVTAAPRGVPIINLVQAGNWTGIGEGNGKDDDDTKWVVPTVKVSEEGFGLTVRGTSMEPMFSEGDIIIVDPNIQAMPGDFVVAKREDHDDATFKQYLSRGADKKGRPVFDLKPLNEAWPTIPVDATNPGRIVGVVVEHRRVLKR